MPLNCYSHSEGYSLSAPAPAIDQVKSQLSLKYILTDNQEEQPPVSIEMLDIQMLLHRCSWEILNEVVQGT